MVRAIVLYDEEPDAERYARHVELCRNVPDSTFRHGRVFGAPMGEPKYGKPRADAILARSWELEELTSVTELIRLFD